MGDSWKSFFLLGCVAEAAYLMFKRSVSTKLPRQCCHTPCPPSQKDKVNVG